MPPPPPPLLGAVAPAPAAAAPTLLHLSFRTRRRLSAPRAVASLSGSHAHDALFLRRAADVADRSAGLTSPHPNFGCVIARPQLETDSVDAWVVGEGFLYAQGTPCAELLAAQEAGEHARGATAYLNLEPGDCYGDSTAVSSLVQVLHGIASPKLPSRVPHLFLQCANSHTLYKSHNPMSPGLESSIISSYGFRWCKLLKAVHKRMIMDNPQHILTS